MKTILCLAPGPLDHHGQAALALVLGNPILQPVTVLVLSSRPESILPVVPQDLRFLHLSDPMIAMMDDMTLGQVIAEVLRQEAPAVVVTGDASSDEGLGVLPASIAHHWPAPILSQVVALDSLATSTESVALTVLAGGRESVLAVKVPVVVSVLPIASVPIHFALPASAEQVSLVDFSIDQSELIPRPSLVGEQVSGPLPETLSIDQFIGRLSR